ncbi:MAG TPA: response regulator [Candidatus Saccharimonadia bacterium]|jgi:two-component system response regulator/two-component system chemotaxis response regulator CheY
MLPKVLLIEDDEAIREIYAMKFELVGFSIQVAENGQVALGKLSDFDPNFILLDMMMPVMGGEEFLRRLGPRVHKTHVIVFSNMAGARQQDIVRRLGAEDFWVKSDYTPDLVAEELVRRWLAG